MTWKTSILRQLSLLELEVRYRLSEGNKSEREPPIFIVGCGHSGTTLLLKIVGAHSRIHPIHYESYLGFHPEKAVDMANTFQKMCSNANKVRWVEKSPKHIHKIPVLAELFPEAKFLLLLRDGRDVACSIKRRTGDIETGIQRWVDDNAAAVPLLDQTNVMLVRYEDLIGDFQGSVRTLVNFCGESYEDDIENFQNYHLDFQERELLSKWVSVIFEGRKRSKSAHRSRRHHQIHRELFDGRNIWKKELVESDKDIIKEKASDLLQHFGYAENDDW